ncbi:MAG: hypothetical protein BWY31_01763 [Lentisphaerae bacterium ADurb.Bin242]|nr:MAG: hypothetical protein BWY31_01763 [Lentisphaerae bacterium ADurb.Bin242]
MIEEFLVEFVFGLFRIIVLEEQPREITVVPPGAGGINILVVFEVILGRDQKINDSDGRRIRKKIPVLGKITQIHLEFVVDVPRTSCSVLIKFSVDPGEGSVKQPVRQQSVGGKISRNVPPRQRLPRIVKKPFAHRRVSEGIPRRAVVAAAIRTGHFRTVIEHSYMIRESFLQQFFRGFVVDARFMKSQSRVELHQRSPVKTGIPAAGAFAFVLKSRLYDPVRVLCLNDMFQQVFSDDGPVGRRHFIVKPIIGAEG